MALAKTKGGITPLTSSGQTPEISLASSYRQSAYIRNLNGAGTITVGAAVRVQVRPLSSSVWYELASLIFGTVASTTETRVVPLPDDASGVRLDYTAPTGGTGHSVDAEFGQITAY